MAPLGTGEVRNALGLKTRGHSAVPDGPAQMAPIMVAAMAVATGQARHVLCFRALTESSSQTATRRASIPGAGRARLGGWYSYLVRSEEHTSELQSLMRISYAVFCLKQKHIYIC